MSEKYLSIFDKRPLIWAHYFILTAVLFLGFYIGERFFALPNQSIYGMFVFWLAVLWIGDSLIHAVLKVD